LKAALDALRIAGCRRAYVNGSFVMGKEEPADFDGCWEVEGVDLERLDSVLKMFSNRREARKNARLAVNSSLPIGGPMRLAHTLPGVLSNGP